MDRDIFWHFPAYLESYKNSGKDFRATPYSTIRSNEWKLIHFYEDDSYQLYNLNDDRMETKDLSSSSPEILSKLKNKLDNWIKATNAPIPTEKNKYYMSK